MATLSWEVPVGKTETAAQVPANVLEGHNSYLILVKLELTVGGKELTSCFHH